MNPLKTTLVAFAGALALAACSGTENAEQTETGWQWAGKGEPGDFAAAASLCQRIVPPMYSREQQISSPLVRRQASYPERRGYWQCMKRRGWVIGG